MNEILSQQVAVLVGIELPVEHFCIRDMADAEKHRTGREIVGLVGPQIAQEKTGDFFLLDITHLIYDGVGKEFDLIVLLGTIEHDLGGTKGFAAVNDRDLRGKAREKKG